MNIESVRNLIKRDKFFVTDHALTESFKDGISLDEILWAIDHGTIIEQYPQQGRCLVSALLPSDVYLHAVLEAPSKSWVEIVTVYIPDRKLWIKGRLRRK